MRLSGIAASFALLATSGQAGATESGPVAGPPPLADLCSLQKAGPFRFGATKAEAAAPHGQARAALDNGYAPFTHATFRTTSWSDLVMLVEFRAPIADPETGQAAEAAVAADLEKGGWSLLGDASGEPGPFDLDIADANRVFTRTGGEAGAPELLYAGLSWRGGKLSLACASAELLALDKLEAGGALPDDARRPVPPPAVTAEPIAVEQCGRPEVQARVAAMFDGGTDPYIDQVGGQGDYWDRLARWQRWRLEKSGKADPSQLDELQFAAGESGQADTSDDRFAVMGALLGSLPRLEAAQKSGDPRQLCTAYVETATFMARDQMQRAERSEALSAVWAAEAARLGVGLD